MTWKFAACGVPYAGRQGGRAVQRWRPRGARSRRIGAPLEPYGDRFLTGPDMGTFPERLPGMAARTRCRTGRGPTRVSAWTTSPPAMASRQPPRPRSRPPGPPRLDGATVAIEGFGKVGAGAARAFARRAGRLAVVAVSTVEGLLADPDGLDVEALISLRERHGDAVVERADPRGASARGSCSISGATCWYRGRAAGLDHG